MTTATHHQPALREALRITGVLAAAGVLTISVLTGTAVIVQMWG
jgi:hypothetical protein